MDKFKEYKLNIWEKEKKLIREYLEKIQNYIAENNIDTELYNDIEEMIFEKLSFETEFDQLKITKILKEVWEPEIIFSDYIENKKTSSQKVQSSQLQDIFYDKLIENERERDNHWAIFLGISGILAKKTGVPVWMIRILFVLFVFVFWISAWFYMLAGLLLPVKWVVYGKLSIWEYLQKQLYLEVKDFIYNTHNTILNVIKFIFVKIFKMFWFIIKFTSENILPIIRFVFFWILSFCFASVLLTLLVIWAFYFSWFSIWNMEFFSVLPSYFLWWIIFWIISVSIFTFWTFLYAINKKILNVYFLTGASFSFLIALFLWISTWFNLTEKYFWSINVTQQAIFDISNITNEGIELDISNMQIDNRFFPFGGISWVKVETSTWNTMTVKIVRKVYWNEQISNAIQSQLNDLVLKQEGNKIILWMQDDKIFKNKVPFSIFETDLILYIPENKKYFINGNYYYFINVHLAEKYQNYQGYFHSNCRLREIYYSQDEEKFVCEATEYEINEAKLSLLQSELIEKFEVISPILHQNQYKRDYYNDYGVISDWSFEKMYLFDEKTLAITFRDMSLEIDAHLNFENTASWVIFSNFEIKDVDVNYPFHPKYYKDISPIEKFIPQEEYEDFSKQ